MGYKDAGVLHLQITGMENEDAEGVILSGGDEGVDGKNVELRERGDGMWRGEWNGKDGVMYTSVSFSSLSHPNVFSARMPSTSEEPISLHPLSHIHTPSHIAPSHYSTFHSSSFIPSKTVLTHLNT